MNMFDFIMGISITFVLGAAIGFERQWRHRLAGIRTNVLVSLGAFLFVTVSMLIEGETSPTRIAAQIVSGIGFLGAGVIMRDGFNVSGLNTAATLWCSAAIGTLTSAGFVIEAVIGTVFVLSANVILRGLTQRFHLYKHDGETNVSYNLRVVCSQNEEFHIRSLLLHMLNTESALLVNLESADMDTLANKVLVQAKVVSKGKQDQAIEKITSRISLEAGITSVGWEIAV